MISWTSQAVTAARGDRDAACFLGKTLLVVGTGGPKRGPVFERLRNLGLGRVLCLNQAPNWAAPYVDDWILADPADPQGGALAAVEAALGVPGMPPLDGIVTFDEFSVQVAALLAERLGLPGAGCEVAERVRNKLAFRRYCLKHGLPAPNCAPVPNDADGALEVIRAEGLRFPLIFKPTCGGGSAMVRKLATEAELVGVLAAYAQLAAQPDAAAWGDRSAFVEEYLDGQEVDIDMLVQGGEVRYCEVTDNFGTSEPYFLETGGCFPSALPLAVQDELSAMATRVVTALGIREGCLHFEARATAKGAVPIEVNMRLGGAEVFAFHRAARGVDLVAEAVKIALGVPVSLPSTERPLRFLASTNFVPTQGGKLLAIDVEPGLWRSPHLVELVVFAEVDTRISVPPEGYQYLGWLVAAGQNAADARAQVEQLARELNFDIRAEA